MVESVFAMKLLNERCLECPICAMFFNSSLTVLVSALFLNGIQLVTKLRNNMQGAQMSVPDRLLLRKRTIIETVNYELKNIAQVEYSRHRDVCNFAVNLPGAVAAHCFFPKKPCIQI